MNILQLVINNRNIYNFLKNDEVKLVFINSLISGSKNYIIKRLKLIVDLKYCNNCNLYEIDNDNKIFIFFKNNIDINSFHLLIYIYGLIKKELKNINKKNINDIYNLINKFYSLLIEINNIKNIYKYNKKIKLIKYIFYYKYILNQENKQIIGYNFKKMENINKKIINQYFKKEEIISFIKHLHYKRFINLQKIGQFNTYCLCIKNIIDKLKDTKFKNRLLKKLYNYEKKYIEKIIN